MLDATVIHCPYCGEPIEILLERSAEAQRYIEDCPVCCRPISIVVKLDRDGSLGVHARAENDV